NTEKMVLLMISFTNLSKNTYLNNTTFLPCLSIISGHKYKYLSYFYYDDFMIILILRESER
ncbi:MAG: hypothetical protein M3Z82_07385, partial [Apilactobacillus sp.]|nr:hypothetical protein [Apilactobacillus sp.]